MHLLTILLVLLVVAVVLWLVNAFMPIARPIKTMLNVIVVVVVVWWVLSLFGIVPKLSHLRLK